MTQIEAIKLILLQNGQIDNFSTINKKLSLRLGARIYDLKQRGWKFEKVFTGKNKNNCVYIATQYGT